MPLLSLTGLLLAATGSVSVDFELHQPAPRQAAVHLCFRGTGQQVRYELEVLAQGPAGRSRSRQAGRLEAGEEARCPLADGVRMAGASRIEGRLLWWVDGLEQPTETRELRLE